MIRRYRAQVDEGIVDRAAGLFARRGFEQTSVQAVADAVGLSKAGLLHHFPSKEALRTAVLEHAGTLGAQALEAVCELPMGPARDRRAIEVLVDVAAAHPGLVAFLLAPLSDGAHREDTTDRERTTIDERDPVVGHIMEAFGLQPEEGLTDQAADLERRIRVSGALVALAVLSLRLAEVEASRAMRSFVINTSFDALGHPRADASTTRPDQVEA